CEPRWQCRCGELHLPCPSHLRRRSGRAFVQHAAVQGARRVLGFLLSTAIEGITMNRSALLCATLLAVLAVYPGEEVRADGRPATRTGISGERSPEPAPVPQVPRRPPWGGTHWTSLAGAAFLPMLSTTAYASG